MQTKTRIVIEDFPVRQETNRERIIHVLREADGVVPQCYGIYEGGGKRCGNEVISNAFGLTWEDNEYAPGITFSTHFRINRWNDRDKLTFAQIADRLERNPNYWNEKADLPYEGAS